MALHHFGLMKQRDERLVSRFDQHELQGISIERNPFESIEDRV